MRFLHASDARESFLMPNFCQQRPFQMITLCGRMGSTSSHFTDEQMEAVGSCGFPMDPGQVQGSSEWLPQCLVSFPH